jgi:hypothetical protein
VSALRGGQNVEFALALPSIRVVSLPQDAAEVLDDLRNAGPFIEDVCPFAADGLFGLFGEKDVAGLNQHWRVDVWAKSPQPHEEIDTRLASPQGEIQDDGGHVRACATV